MGDLDTRYARNGTSKYIAIRRTACELLHGVSHADSDSVDGYTRSLDLFPENDEHVYHE